MDLKTTLDAAQRAGIAHNNGAGGQYLLCATEAQLLAFVAAVAPSASERQQGGECSVCGGTGYFQEPDSEVGHVARECESCTPAPAATRAGEWPPLPDPDGTVEIDQGPAPGGGREVTFGDAWSEPLVLEYVRAVLATQPPQAPPAAPSAEQGEAPVVLVWSGDADGAWKIRQAPHPRSPISGTQLHCYTQPAAPVGWQPIETAPKKSGDGLVDIFTDRRYAGCHWDDICGEYRHIDHSGTLIRLRNAKFWMPPPAAPKTGGANG